MSKWMLVTNDRAEKPLKEFETQSQIATYLGTTPGYIQQMIYNKRWSTCKIKRIDSGKRYVYIATTADIYELPIVVEDTAKRLGERVGVSENYVYSAISKKLSGKHTGIRFYKVELI